PAPVAVSEPHAAPQPERSSAPRNATPSITRLNPAAGSPGESVVIVRDPSALGQSTLLAHLPDPELIEETKFGLLPARDAAGRRPFDHYARPWSGARGARIAILIGGLGISQTGTQEAIGKLPPEITLAFAPLGNSLTRWMQTARREGHEVMLQVPLEPFDDSAGGSGRHMLRAEAPAGEVLRELHWNLGRITNYIGVVNYMGARFTGDEGAMALLMEELRQRGLAYLDDGTSARSLAEEMAREKGVPFAAADTVIDGERTRDAILDKLDALERTARAGGFAIGSGSALDVTVDTVAAWAAEVRKRGIELVPVSALADDPEED
ncbi:divergent polysaccharide deacetylase family protein, partial [Nitratireductor sp. GCM10026969]|uniref:divergent polysaccharide deacetylase family protein n=1 Tax=Nitratireductor sp. GCM10026969 TaxID=3252645 RepID=UPI003619FD79